MNTYKASFLGVSFKKNIKIIICFYTNQGYKAFFMFELLAYEFFNLQYFSIYNNFTILYYF